MQMTTDADSAVTSGQLPVALWMRALAWAILSFIGFMLSPYALLWPVAQTESVLGLPHAAMLGLLALAWTIAGGGVTLLGARLVFGVWSEARIGAWSILGIGAIVAAGHVWVTADWIIARFGYSDPTFAGVTFLLFAVVSGVAVAGFGVQVAPRGTAWAPMLGVALGVLLIASIVASNLPGLADGLAADSLALAIVTGVAVAYAAGVAVLSVRRLRQS